MATRQVRQAGMEIEDVLQERSLQGLGFVAGSVTSGIIGAQEIADRILPLLQMPREPQTAAQFAASGGVKTGTAIAAGAVAARTSGLPLLILAFAGLGALGSAGADFVNAIQRTGLVAEQTRSRGRSRQDYSQPETASPSSPSSPSGDNGGGAAAELTV